MNLMHPTRSNNGSATIRLEQLDKKLSGDMVKMVIEGKLHKKRKAFFKLLREKEITKEYIPVYQSEGATYFNDRAKWQQVKVAAASLMRDNPDMPLKIELYEYKSGGSHVLLGSNKFTFNQLADNYNWDGDFGKISFSSVELVRRPTFIEYLFGGVNISLSIAIDFTGSNGNPKDYGSLHFYDPTQNQYVKAIQSVGSILQEYDADKNIPVFGFGAVLPSFSEADFCFALNGNIFAPEIHGVDEVLNYYKKNLVNLSFAGPTIFAPIIKYVGDMAEFYVKCQKPYNYFVLLITTDGRIDDIEETINEIVRCTFLPVSIIIVGIGDNDFSDMDRLDADTKPLVSKTTGQMMARDIVQFVPFSKFVNDPNELARATLAELPKQVVDYMTSRQIQPLPKGAILAEQQMSADTFYQKRKADFAALFQTVAAPAQIEGLLKVGFPVENPRTFEFALSHGYSNILCKYE